MTQPEDQTIPSRPEKAHGDALEDAVEASAEEGRRQAGESADADQGG